MKAIYKTKLKLVINNKIAITYTVHFLCQALFKRLKQIIYVYTYKSYL